MGQIDVKWDKNMGVFKTSFQYILGLMLKSVILVSFDANLTHFGPKLYIPVELTKKSCYTSGMSGLATNVRDLFTSLAEPKCTEI